MAILADIKAKILNMQRHHILLGLIVSSVAIGVVVGCSMHPKVNPTFPALNIKQLYFLEFPGLIFLRMMSVFVVPLAVCSNISSLSSTTHRAVGRMSILALILFTFTTFMGGLFGTLLAVSIRPGDYRFRDLSPASQSINGSVVGESEKRFFGRTLQLDETVLNLLLNLVPSNIISASFKTTDLHFIRDVKIDDLKNSTENLSGDAIDQSVVTGIFTSLSDRANIFGLFAFSITFGLALQHVPIERARYVSEFFEASRQALLGCITFLIWYFPIGTVSLIAYRIVVTDDLHSALLQLSIYTVTTLLSLILQLLFLTMLYLVITRKNPLKLIYNVYPALTCAAGTASSAMTLPVTLSCLSTSQHVNNSVVRFLLPLGTTLNMNGTAVLQAVAPIFMLQRLDRPLGAGSLMVILFSAVLTSMVTGTVPSGGLVTLTITLGALGMKFLTIFGAKNNIDIPVNMVSVVLPVDWLLDRVRTPINVYGNAIAAGIVSHFLADEFSKETPGEEENLVLEVSNDHPSAKVGNFFPQTSQSQRQQGYLKTSRVSGPKTKSFGLKKAKVYSGFTPKGIHKQMEGSIETK